MARETANFSPNIPRLGGSPPVSRPRQAQHPRAKQVVPGVLSRRGIRNRPRRTREIVNFAMADFHSHKPTVRVTSRRRIHRRDDRRRSRARKVLRQSCGTSCGARFETGTPVGAKTTVGHPAPIRGLVPVGLESRPASTGRFAGSRSLLRRSRSGSADGGLPGRSSSPRACGRA